MTVDVVELDAEVLSIAERFFGMTPNERVHATVDDGIEYVKRVSSAGTQGNNVSPPPPECRGSVGRLYHLFAC